MIWIHHLGRKYQDQAEYFSGTDHSCALNNDIKTLGIPIKKVTGCLSVSLSVCSVVSRLPLN